MKKRRIALILFCALMLLLLALQVAVPHPQTPEQPLAQPISAGNADNVSRLLNDLVKAHRSLAAEDMRQIDADLEAIRTVDGRDYEIAKAVAEHWRKVYLDPDYELCLYRGEEKAGVLRDFGIEDSPAHAFVVLGYELMDGEMQPELMSRCDAAAAAARAFPSTILVCSGGATGANNPQGHTEAGRMKAYLTERCGIEASRIFIDEQAMTTAENAVNTFEILRREGVRTMTIVTSDYHQRWGRRSTTLSARCTGSGRAIPPSSRATTAARSKIPAIKTTIRSPRCRSPASCSCRAAGCTACRVPDAAETQGA